MVMIICSNCKGNGYIRLRFEAEESIHQCKVCNSQGEIEKEKEEEQQKFTAGKNSSCHSTCSNIRGRATFLVYFVGGLL